MKTCFYQIRMMLRDVLRLVPFAFVVRYSAIEHEFLEIPNAHVVFAIAEVR